MHHRKYRSSPRVKLVKTTMGALTVARSIPSSISPGFDQHSGASSVFCRDVSKESINCYVAQRCVISRPRMRSSQSTAPKLDRPGRISKGGVA